LAVRRRVLREEALGGVGAGVELVVAATRTDQPGPSAALVADAVFLCLLNNNVVGVEAVAVVAEVRGLLSFLQPAELLPTSSRDKGQVVEVVLFASPTHLAPWPALPLGLVACLVSEKAAQAVRGGLLEVGLAACADALKGSPCLSLVQLHCLGFFLLHVFSVLLYFLFREGKNSYFVGKTATLWEKQPLSTREKQPLSTRESSLFSPPQVHFPRGKVLCFPFFLFLFKTHCHLVCELHP